MTQIWIGVSKTLDFEDLISKYIDPLFVPQPSDHETPTALLVSEFGASIFDPGTFEVYARSRHETSNFDSNLFNQLSPFQQVPQALAQEDFKNVSCMFFVICANKPSKLSDGEVTITDVMNVSFD